MARPIGTVVVEVGGAVRRCVATSSEVLGRPVRVDDRHGWKVLEPVHDRDLERGPRRWKSAIEVGSTREGWPHLGVRLKDFAQQRRHDLKNSYPLASISPA